MKINKLMAVPAIAATFALAGIGTLGAQVSTPRVALQFATNGLTSPLAASSTNATIARLLLDTTGSSEAVRIASLPFNLVVGGGANASTLSNCIVYNEAAPTIPLNTSATTTTMVSGNNNISFTNPLVLAANTLTTLALRCDVAGNLVAGGTFTVNMNTNDVVATGALTGIPALVTVRGATVVPPIVVYPTPVPGMPATGAGGESAQNLAMIAASLLIASLGFSYLNLRKKQN